MTIKIPLALVFLGLLTASGLSAYVSRTQAMPPTFPIDCRIGFVSLQKVVAESKLGRAGSESMKSYTTAGTRNQAEIDKLNQSLLDDFEKKVVPIVEAMRLEMNLWVIFTQDANATGAINLIAVNPAIDLTSELVKRLDRKHPGLSN